MIKFIKRLACNHKYEFKENVYGDTINYLNCRSIFECVYCGKEKYRDYLYHEKFW